VEAFPISSNARVTGYWVFCIYCSWQYYNWYRYPNFNMTRVDLDMRALAFEYFGWIDGTSDIHLDHGVSMIHLLRFTLWNWILNNEVSFSMRTRYWCANTQNLRPYLDVQYGMPVLTKERKSKQPSVYQVFYLGCLLGDFEVFSLI